MNSLASLCAAALAAALFGVHISPRFILACMLTACAALTYNGVHRDPAVLASVTGVCGREKRSSSNLQNSRALDVAREV